ncbi:MAG: alpha/beta fold hydrolase [Campylobacterales bacterium]|nr:alpha/beta fold hydrolase [Campylobacterales bacterium]
MIIYIHGFGGSGLGGKASVLKESMREHGGIIAPSLPTNPHLAIQTLSELIESFRQKDNVYLIGSSLGGYYALHLSSKYNLPAVLINPAIKPYETLRRALGYAPNFYDGSTYEWREEHLDILKSLETDQYDTSKLLVLLQKGDELLDYQDALAKLDGARFVVEDGGSHSFDGIERHVDTIQDFFSLYGTVLTELFARISDADVQKFLCTVDKKDLVYAMASLPDVVQDRIFDNLTQKAKDGIKEEIAFAGRDITPQSAREAIEGLDKVAKELFSNLLEQ